MRVFISADIEGTAFTTIWPETDHGEEEYPAAAERMRKALGENTAEKISSASETLPELPPLPEDDEDDEAE